MNIDSNHGLWIDELSGQHWADSCGFSISVWLGDLASEERPRVVDRLRVKTGPPTFAEAKRAFEENTDLSGCVRCQWGDDAIELVVPMPFHGAFFSHRPDFQHGLVSVWASWLGEEPGFRLVRPTSEARRDNIQWRIGLPGGRFVGATLNKPTTEERKRLNFLRYFGSATVYPGWLRSYLPVRGRPKDWDAVIEAIHANPSEASDEDDLSHRILVTYPVWLKHRIAREFLKLVLEENEGKLGKRAALVLSGVEAGTLDLAREAWLAVQRGKQTAAQRLVWAIHAHKSADKTDWVDPINPLDLASRITRVRRVHLPASKLDEVPAVFRQNHPSFRGRLCPVESPESEQVGLSLQLAAGTSVDFDGHIHPATESAAEIGFGAALVPFFAHNDGARNMMGAKNLRQAVPVRKPSRPAVTTGREVVLQEFVRPLVEIGVCPGAISVEGGFGLGHDLLVAYLPWHGMNFEDAIVLGQQVVDKGLLDLAFYKRVRRPIKLGWVPADPVEQTVWKWSEKGLAKAGTELVAGSPLASFVWEGKADSKRLAILYEERTPAILKAIRFDRRSEWTGGVLEYELELPIPVRPGDKLMGRHGNKGVVGAILHADKMPRLPDSQTLPEELRGRTIDVLLNPHGVISRMNLGQLIETHLGWVLHSGQCQAGDLLKPGFAESTPMAAPFSDALSHDKVQQWLEKTGLDPYGRIRLVLPDGTMTISPVTVGFQHIVRLRHVAELKSQARRGGQDALYSTKTGQAIHGRKLGGGQRLGEMEIWALAGHSAEAVLAEFLGLKSSAELVASPGCDKPVSGPPGCTGYSRTLQDWLSALLINLDVGDDHVRLSFSDSATLPAFAGQVNSPRGLDSCVTASFACRQGGNKKPCDFRLLNGDQIAFAPPTQGGQAKAPTLALRDLLDHLLLLPGGALRRDEATFALALKDMETGQAAGVLSFEFTAATDQLKGVARPVAGKQPTRWPLSLQEVYLYGRFDKGDGKNWSADDLLAEFEKEGAQRSVAEMRITCPDHSTSRLAGAKPFGQVLRGTPGGLFDPRIFGSGIPTSTDRNSNRWGYIGLPIEIPYPLHVFLTTSRSPKDQAKAFDSFLKVHKIERPAIPMIQRIPVLPSRYRMPANTKGGLIADVIERRGYAPLVQSCLRYEHAKDDEQRTKIASQIERQVETLFQMLVEALRHKSGMIRRHGLGRRVDRSARLVVTPNPELDWDDAGIPTTVLLELIGDLVAAWLEGRSATEKAHEPMANLARLSWLHPKEDPLALAEAQRSLRKYLEAHPNFVVLLNRQPSLHRDSFQAFHPVPLPPEAGDVIQLCPLTCKGFAADFDGDEMVIHVPLGADAQKEAARLLPSRNLFSLATEAPGNVLAHFDQDFVLGTYWLGAVGANETNAALGASLPGDCCRTLIPAARRMSKGDGIKLLSHLATNHPDKAAQCIAEWMRMAFAACSKMGVSFGFYELREIASRIAADVTRVCENKNGKSNDELQKISGEALDRIVADPSDFGCPGLHFAAMALSGARGKKQVRQIIAARGLLEPGTTGFKVGEDMGRFFFRQSLVDGLGPEEAFFAAMNARSSMCDKKLGTGYAGALTRALVFALWPYRIVSADCGSKEQRRNPATCLVQDGFCAACYGALPGGTLPEMGFPAGLIAAQSIGERGTQLSMQSFHTGQSAVDIHYVRRVLGIGAKLPPPEFRFVNPAEAQLFLKKLRGSDAYQDVLARHFEIVWKVLSWSQNKDLLSAIVAQDSITRLAHRDQPREIALAALTGQECPRANPFAKVLFGGFGKAAT
jgi:hypothetical protein